MNFNSIADLPASTSSLTLIQKSNLLKSANTLINRGVSPEKAVEELLKSVLKIGEKEIKSNLNKQSKSVIEDNKQEEMISYEIIYEPDTKDAHGNWMTKDTLVKAKESYDLAVKAGIVKENLFHLTETDSFTIEKTWIQEEFDVVVSGTNEPIKAGSWVAKVKYNSLELWELKKANVVGGLSIQCEGIIDKETGEITDIDFLASAVDTEDEE